MGHAAMPTKGHNVKSDASTTDAHERGNSGDSFHAVNTSLLGGGTHDMRGTAYTYRDR